MLPLYLCKIDMFGASQMQGRAGCSQTVSIRGEGQGQESALKLLTNGWIYSPSLAF